MLSLGVGSQGIVSLTQNLNEASKTDIVVMSAQPAVSRITGLDKEYYVVHVAPDFDDSIDLMNVNV